MSVGLAVTHRQRIFLCILRRPFDSLTFPRPPRLDSLTPGASPGGLWIPTTIIPTYCPLSNRYVRTGLGAEVELLANRQYFTLPEHLDTLDLNVRQPAFTCTAWVKTEWANEWIMTWGSSQDVSTYTGYTGINSIKALNSLCTVVTLICLLRSYYLEQVVHNAHMHVHRLHDIHGSFWNTGYWWLINKWLWLEMIVVGIHCNPPGYSTNLVFAGMGRKNISVMRSEVTYEYGPCWRKILRYEKGVCRKEI